MMKFTCDNPGGYSTSVELSSATSIDDVVEAFEAFLHAVGFSHENITEVLGKRFEAGLVGPEDRTQ